MAAIEMSRIDHKYNIIGNYTCWVHTPVHVIASTYAYNHVYTWLW